MKRVIGFYLILIFVLLLTACNNQVMVEDSSFFYTDYYNEDNSYWIREQDYSIDEIATEHNHDNNAWNQALLGEDFVRSRMQGDSIRDYVRITENDRNYELITTYHQSSDFFDYETWLFISEFSNGNYDYTASFRVPSRRANANNGLLLVDVDFDGVNDILVWLGHEGNQGIITYAAFLNRGNMYVESDFDEIPFPLLDIANKRIGGTVRNWAASHSMFLYEFSNGSFVLTDYFTREMCQVTHEIKYVINLRDGYEVDEIYWLNSNETQIDMIFYDEESRWGISSIRWRAIKDIYAD